MTQPQTSPRPPEIPQLALGSKSPRNRNPFSLPEDINEIGYSLREEQERKESWKKTANMTLVKRSESVRPSIPPLSTRSSIFSKTPRVSAPGSVTARNRERTALITERIAEKRDVFLLQLMMNKKDQQIAQFSEEIKNIEQEFAEKEANITNEMRNCKITTNRIESELVQARKLAETATARRVALEKELHQFKSRIAAVKSELYKNEDSIEVLRVHKSFIQQICSSLMNPKDFIKDTSNLVNYMSDLETDTENLALMCDQFETQIQCRQAESQSAIKRIQSDVDAVKREIEARHSDADFDQHLSPANLRDLEAIEAELQSLSAKVKETYSRCFGVLTGLSAIEMLEKLENRLEDIYRRIQLVSPSFRAEKLAQQEARRREIQRKADIEARERLNKEKKQQAIERSHRPINKRMGRPLMTRTMPDSATKKNSGISDKKQKEIDRIEALLYDPNIL